MNEITDRHIAKAIATLHADDASVLADMVETVIAFIRTSGSDGATREFRLRMMELRKAMDDECDILNDDD